MTLATNYPTLQAAVNATESGDILQLPPLPISITAPVAITRDIAIQGTTKEASAIVVPPNQDGLVVSGSAHVRFADFSIDGTYQTGAGALIRYASSNGTSVFRNLGLNFGYDGIIIQSGETNLIDGCWMQQYMHTGITINGNDDNSIISCSVDTGQPNGVGIAYNGSCGGLRIHNTKVLGGEIAFMVDFASNMADGDLLITGCSFEVPTYGVFITGQPGALFSNIILSGNEIAAGSYSFVSFPTSSGNWLKNLILTGNLFYGKVSVGGVISGYVNVGNVEV